MPSVLVFYNVHATEINNIEKPTQITFKYSDELPTQATVFQLSVHLCLAVTSHFTQVLEQVLLSLGASDNLG